MRVRAWAIFGTLLWSIVILHVRAVLSSGRSVSGICRLNQVIVVPRSLAWTTGVVRGGHSSLVDKAETQTHLHGSLTGEQRHPGVGKQEQEKEEGKVVEPHFMTEDIVRWLQLVLDGYAKFTGCREQLAPREGSKESQAVAVALLKDRAVLSHDFMRNPSDPIYCYGNKAALGWLIPAHIPVICCEIGK